MGSVNTSFTYLKFQLGKISQDPLPVLRMLEMAAFSSGAPPLLQGESAHWVEIVAGFSLFTSLLVVLSKFQENLAGFWVTEPASVPLLAFSCFIELADRGVGDCNSWFGRQTPPEYLFLLHPSAGTT